MVGWCSIGTFNDPWIFSWDIFWDLQKFPWLESLNAHLPSTAGRSRELGGWWGMRDIGKISIFFSSGKNRGLHGTIIEKNAGFDVQRCASPSTVFDDYSEVNFGSEILSWWVVLATFSCKGFTDDSQMIFGAVEGVCQLGRWTSRNVRLRGSRAMGLEVPRLPGF